MGSTWTTSTVQLAVGPAGQAAWFNLQGGQTDPQQHSWSSSSTGGIGSSIIDTNRRRNVPILDR